ncbi:TPA: glycosyltransferase family 4 protein [Citrobacter amalonaticus]|nr:glycosyltransferase family 4 protein [Citrobacter amalonaticus]
MNIVHVIPTLSTGGAEQFVITLANEMSREHNVTIITLFSSQNDIVKKRIIPSVKLIELNLALEKKLSAAYQINFALHKIKPSIVHTHLSSPLYILPYAIFKRNQCNFVHTVHNIAEFDAPRKINKYANNIYFKKCNALPVSITEKVAESVKNYYQITNNIVIHNGTNAIGVTDNYNKVKAKIKEIKSAHKFVLCHVARIDPQKNHKLLLDTIKLIPDCYVISMGAITKDNENYANDLLSMACHIENFEYIGVVSNVSDYITACDAIIFSSNFEGLPISLIESMSIGKICISTPAGGITDVLDNKVGFLSDGFSVKALKSAVELFISVSDDERNEIQAQIIKKYHKVYSIDNCAKSYIEVYNRRSCI